MKILVFGAGVLGSLYAARLHISGQQVTILARGSRQFEIEQDGIILVEEQSRKRFRAQPRVINSLAPDDVYDCILVLVRKNQLASALPVLAANSSPMLLFMVNNAAGPGDIIAAVGHDRTVLGFPGAGGAKEGSTIYYNIVPQLIQPTTIGELDGRRSRRLLTVAAALRQAGFPTVLCANMDAWLKSHIALVCPIADAIYAAGGSNARLARQPENIHLMLRAIREGFQALDALQIPVTPKKLRLLQWLPLSLLVPVMGRVMATGWAENVIARHAVSARDEMQMLADEFQLLSRRSGVHTHAIEALTRSISPL